MSNENSEISRRKMLGLIGSAAVCLPITASLLGILSPESRYKSFRQFETVNQIFNDQLNAINSFTNRPKIFTELAIELEFSDKNMSDIYQYSLNGFRNTQFESIVVKKEHQQVIGPDVIQYHSSNPQNEFSTWIGHLRSMRITPSRIHSVSYSLTGNLLSSDTNLLNNLLHSQNFESVLQSRFGNFNSGINPSADLDFHTDFATVNFGGYYFNRGRTNTVIGPGSIFVPVTTLDASTEATDLSLIMFPENMQFNFRVDSSLMQISSSYPNKLTKQTVMNLISSYR